MSNYSPEMIRRLKSRTKMEMAIIVICALYLHSCKTTIKRLFTTPEPREWAPDTYKRTKAKEVLDPKEEGGMKKILQWNYYNFKLEEGHEPFVSQGCRYTNCVFTKDRNRYPMQQLDAVLWHANAADTSFPDQRLVDSDHRIVRIVTHEASYHIRGIKSGDLSSYNNVFNWTFHYRNDADIYAPYGTYEQIAEKRIGQMAAVMRNKTRMIAWFVSDCNSLSGREELVKQLQKHITVDIYGACGTLTCIRGKSDCEGMLEKKYYFYLALENSLCEDYITEKLYYTLRNYVVPVVWGLGNYVKNAPPHSVINALAFPNVTALANYLVYLKNNHTAYYEYFLWKRNYKPVIRGDILKNAMCDICERLHTDNSTKVYRDIHWWFAPERQCLTIDNARIATFLNH
ncbi:alpha-(1,3)-fucosyltransferase fut-1-like [Penaeus japonicus]|uniref:alpha-(1,3)-fucosyltransferase fut-1-like n=1 Tax=Penaeus japonicus TaxID=27405 RepID=UPI001C712DD4|nr:alpha-(1,3)-fucosyltransferase fut-1-like [Penaeus japonicus]